MAFDKDNWSVLGGQSKSGTVPALYCYTTTEAHTAVDASLFQ